MWLLPLLAALGGSNVLDGAAMSSPRPDLCKPAAGFWAQLGKREQLDFCSELAKAYSRLPREPVQAEGHARRALNYLEHPAAVVALARALAAQRRYAEAWEAFAQSGPPQRSDGELALGVQTLGGTGGLHDFARTAAMGGRAQSALEAYRRLVPRLELLPEGEHVAALVEAAIAVLRVGGAVEEAAGYLANAQRRRARRASESYLPALERTMARMQEGALLEDDEVDGTWLEPHVQGSIRPNAPHLPLAELRLLLAVVTEPGEPALARDIAQPLLAADSGLAEPLRRWAVKWWSQGNP